jgi:WD40-like Beta Propeller Repeat
MQWLRASGTKQGVIALSALALMIGCVGTSFGTGAASDDSDAAVDGGVADGSSRGEPMDGSVGDALRATDSGAKHCDPSKAFTDIRQVPGLNSPSEFDSDVRLSPDELEAYFVAKRAAAGATSADVFRATRPTRTSAFTSPILVTAINSGLSEDAPTLPADFLSVVFSRSSDLWIATRSVPSSAFGAPALLDTVNSVEAETDPYFVPNGSGLYLISTRGGNADLFRSAKSGLTFAEPVAINELNSAETEGSPIISDDELVIYWSSQRTDILGTTAGVEQIFSATRSQSTAPFGNIKRVAELASGTKDKPDWLSPDLCRLYFHSARSGVSDIFVAERQP